MHCLSHPPICSCVHREDGERSFSARLRVCERLEDVGDEDLGIDQYRIRLNLPHVGKGDFTSSGRKFLLDELGDAPGAKAVVILIQIQNASASTKLVERIVIQSDPE